MGAEISEYGKAILFLIGGLLFCGGTLVASRLIAPFRPNAEKRTSYECGEEPVGASWGQFNMRFYLMGLIFLIFDVELLLLFPWAVVYADATLLREVPGWGWVALVEAVLFMVILVAGLVYIWAQGDIEWVKPVQQVVTLPSAVPSNLYSDINNRYAARTAPPAVPTVISSDAHQPIAS